MAFAEQVPDDEPPLTRKRWTAADLRKLQEVGFFSDKEPYELLNGELFELAPQGPLHVRLQTKLLRWIMKQAPAELEVVPSAPLRLSEDQEPEPDIFLHESALDSENVRGPDALLVIEVSDSTLRRDRVYKAAIYAAQGVKLYWVVDASHDRTWIYTLQGDAFGEPERVPFEEKLKVPFINEPLIIADLLR